MDSLDSKSAVTTGTEVVADPQCGPVADRECLPYPIVGIGGSAGGFEPLQDFFRSMPRDPGMAFVVVQHGSPAHQVVLGQILGSSTSMPVQSIIDGLPV